MTTPYSKEGIQRLLTASGYYKGRIDGDWGDQTSQAAEVILKRHTDKIVPGFDWTNKDKVVLAAAQMILLYTNNSPGQIDGLWGHNSQNAYENWVSLNTKGTPVTVDRTPVPPPAGVKPVKAVFPSQAGCVAFYGQPGLPGSAAEKAMSTKLVSIQLPFPFRIDFALDKTTRTMRLHSKCAESAEAAYQRVFERYGHDKMVALGLDRFAGSYFPRLMRGSSSTFSMHAYGCAIDTYAAPNGLNMHKPSALFSRPEYKDWFDIWAEFGWTSLGRAIDRDYMHVQAAHL